MKKWYKVDIEKIRKDYKNISLFGKANNLTQDDIKALYNFNKRKISRDNKYYDLFKRDNLYKKNYLEEIKLFEE